ncbi:MAG TPA: HlyD family secretion protein [Polyangiaceae bacterium]|jgi:membrane fusion protein (multidrug efflux system)
MASADNALSGTAAMDGVKVTAAKKSRARPYVILALVVAGILVLYLGFRALTVGRENTDDAQVGADMVPIAARVSGTVIAVPVVDHQSVKKGDLLAQIDPADYENKVKLAQAEIDAARAQADAADAQMRIVAASSKGGLSTARAALSGTTSSVAGADAQVEAAKAAVLRAQADAEKAETDLKRAQSLRKDDAIPQAQVDSLTAGAAAQRAAVAQAQAQLAAASEMKNTARSRIAEAQGRLEQSTPVEAQLAAAKANADLAHARVGSAETHLAQAQLDLSYTKILAPSDGHISKLAVHVGQLLSTAQTVTNLLPATTYVVANFKETQVGEMRVGQTANITLDAFPGRTFHAKVDSVAYGTGAQFSLLPPDNASGNFVKVVQRVPVKLAWTDLPDDVRVEAGLSADVTVMTK